MSDLHVKTPGGSRAAFLALKHALGTADATHHTHGERHDASSACAAHPFLGAGARGKARDRQERGYTGCRLLSRACPIQS